MSAPQREDEEMSGMPEHPNAELWRKAQAAFSHRDIDALREYWSDDIVYHVPGARRRLAGDYKGLGAVVAFFAELMETGSQITDVHDVLTTDDHVVALIRLELRREGRELSVNLANIYHVLDGKITEAWLLSTDQAAMDEFLA